MTRLDYESPQPVRRFRRASDVAFVTSLAATPSLCVSILMYELMPRAGVVQTIQLSLGWTSVALAAAGLFAVVLACFVVPRGPRFWIAVLALLTYACLFAAAMTL